MDTFQRDLNTLMATRGAEPIGAAQRTIAYTVVADNGDGNIKFTAAGHGLVDHQTFYIGTGLYEGVHQVKEVVDNDHFLVEADFDATAAGNINLTASLNGEGFIVIGNPTIAEFEPLYPDVDAAAIKAVTYIAGQHVQIPFRRIRISAGNILCVHAQPRAKLTYDAYDSRRPGSVPVLISAVVEDAADDEIVLTFVSKADLMDSVPAISKITLSGIASTPTITGITIDEVARTATLALDDVVVATDVPLISYEKPSSEKAFQDIFRNKVDSFEEFEITNNVVA